MNLDQINDLHERGMDLAELAMVARTRGDLVKWREALREALKFASEAAIMIAPHVEEEPMRSVLHRSAASLAIQCEEYRTAEKMLGAGLCGEPPPEIADEMRDLLGQVYAHRELLVS